MTTPDDTQRSPDRPVTPGLSPESPPPDAAAPTFFQPYPGAPPVPASRQVLDAVPESRLEDVAPDDRPKTLAFVSLGMAILGLILLMSGLVSSLGVLLIYVPGSEYAAVIILLAAIVLSLIVLGSHRQGGKRIGVTALIAGVAGGLLAVVIPVIIFVLIVTADMRAFS